MSGAPRRHVRKGTTAGADPSESIVNSDKRLQWIESRVLAAFRPPPGGPKVNVDVRKSMDDDDMRRDVLQFFDSENCRVLFIYLTPQGVYMSSVGVQEGVSSKKVLCLRKQPTGPQRISMENVGSQLEVVEISAKGIDCIHHWAHEIYAPLLSISCSEDPSATKKTALSSPVAGSISSAPVVELLENDMFQLEQVALQLAGEANGRTFLALPPPAARGFASDANALEKLAAEWIAQLRAVLAEEDDEISGRYYDGSTGSLAPVDPLHEWEYWKWRGADLEQLLLQAQGSVFQGVVSILSDRSEHYATALKSTASHLATTKTDAETVCRWLAPLVQHFESFDTFSPRRIEYPELVTHNVFPILYHLLALLWSKNAVYSTNTRMGSLLLGVNQSVLHYSDSHASLEHYFLSDPVEASTRLTAVFDVCGSVKASYLQFKNKVTNSDKEWKVPHKVLFGTFDTYLERCRDLVDILSIRKQMEWLRSVDTGFVDGAPLKQTIYDVVEMFFSELSKYAAKVLPLMTDAAPTFDRLTTQFRATVSSMLQQVSNGVISHLRTAAMGPGLIRRLVVLKPLFNLPALEPCFDGCVAILATKWSEEIRLTQRRFQENIRPEQRPYQEHLPLAAQRIITAMSNLQRLDSLYAEVKQLLSLYHGTEHTTGLEGLQTTLLLHKAAASKLLHYVEDSYRAWLNSIPESLKALERPVLRRPGDMNDTETKGDEYFVFVDPVAVEAIENAKALQRLRKISFCEENFPRLPDSPELQKLLSLSIPLWERRIALETAIETYLTLRNEMSETEAALLVDELTQVSAALAPGLQDVTWSGGAVVELYTQRCTAAVQSLVNTKNILRDGLQGIKDRLLKVHDAATNDEKRLLLPLLISRIGDKTLALEEFLSRHEFASAGRRQVASDIVSSLDVLPQMTLEAINASKDKDGLARVQERGELWLNFLGAVEDEVTKAVKQQILVHLDGFRTQTSQGYVSQHNTVGMPLLDVRLLLQAGSSSALEERETVEGGSLELQPSFVEIRTAVERYILDPLEEAKEYPSIVAPYQNPPPITPPSSRRASTQEEEGEGTNSRSQSQSGSLELSQSRSESQDGSGELEEGEGPHRQEDSAEKGEGEAADDTSALPARFHPCNQPTLEDDIITVLIHERLQSDEELSSTYESLNRMLDTTESSVEGLIRQYGQYTELFDTDVEHTLKRKLCSSKEDIVFGSPLDTITEHVSHYEKMAHSIQKEHATASVAWLKVDCRVLKATLKQKALSCARLLVQHIEDRIRQTLSDTGKFMAEINANIESDIVTGQDDSGALRHVFELLRSIRQRNGEVQSMFHPMAVGVRFLQRYPGTDREALMIVEEEIQALEPQWDNVYSRSLTVREQLTALQDREVASIREDVASYRQLIEDTGERFHSSALFQQLTIAPTRAYELLDQWREDWMELDKQRQEILKLFELFEMTDKGFDALDNFIDELSLVKQLWDIIALVSFQFEDWDSTPFSDVDTAVLVERTQHFSQLIAAFPTSISAWKSTKTIASRVKNLTVALPLIQQLRSPAMRKRHWDQLLALTHTVSSVEPDSMEFTLAKLRQLNLHSYIGEVSKLVEQAEKEQVIERSLVRIARQWSTCEILIMEKVLNRFHIPLLHGIDHILELLEDHTNALQSMQTSRWVAYFKTTVDRWQKDLSVVDVTTTLWMDIQKQWCSLQPIFVLSEDMRQQLPEDAKAFDEVDAVWQETMKRLKPGLLVVDVCTTQILLQEPAATDEDAAEGLFKRLEGIKTVLDVCEKSLSEYLESKRRIFPRFYFVSDADLVEMLAKSNHPPSVLAHIGKIIGAVEKCKFISTVPDCHVEDDIDTTPKEIDALISLEGEVLELLQKTECTGKVETWLQGIVDQMKAAVRQQIVEAATTYTEQPRVEWMFRYVIQAVCIAARLHWVVETSSALEAVEGGNASAMSDHARHLKTQLASTIDVVLKPLSAERRKALITLITIDVHCRDVVLDLVAQRIDTSLAFAWQSQLRMYMRATATQSPPQDEEEVASGFARGGQYVIDARIADAEFEHGSEYIGNCGCLVVTPLTDRCYITLTQALKLHKGGAPAGPAGTGKTETVKDIGHVLGRPVYVFNCSEQMDYLSVGNIFKGLSMSGSWGCFDEFNRIAIEVLSVVATQVKTILNGLRRQEKSFRLGAGDGALKLSRDVGIFITMNPGYKGRTELPENIKALFRPCAMVVPDVKYISEIMLSAEGFLTAKELSHKFVKLYQLCSELLSPQQHYDWGLRAMRAVLFLAGSLKRKEPMADEKATVMKALRDSNHAKLSKGDVHMFMRLISALFPSVHADEMEHPRLDDALTRVAGIHNYVLGEGNAVRKKCNQLYDLLKVRHSVFVLGPAGSGKSSVIKLLAHSLELMGEEEGVRTFRETFDPKSLSCDELYGCVHPQSREWQDGVLSRIFREYATNPRYRGNHHAWIVLDGAIDADWIESMNSVMDDNKLLTLANNERIVMSPNMRLVFEIGHLRNATPATVSRAGILYLNESDVGWTPMKDRWLAQHTSEREKTSLDILFDKHIHRFLNYVQKSMVPMSSVAYVRALCYLLKGMLALPGAYRLHSETYEKMFLMCCVWAFGNVVPFPVGVVDYRQSFSAFVRREWPMLRLPEGGNVFDYYLHIPSDETEDFEWRSWEQLLQSDLEAFGPDQPTSGQQENEMEMARLLKKVEATTGAFSPYHVDRILPTIETTKFGYMASLVAPHKTPMLFVGSTGVGKSVIASMCAKALPPDNYDTVSIHFSALTDAADYQSKLETRLEKRAGRTFGPLNRKKLIVVLENLNLPLPDRYGSQSAVALIRQHMDYGFWYSRPKLQVHEVVDVQYLAVMDPLGGPIPLLDRLQQQMLAVGVGFASKEMTVKLMTQLLSTEYHHVRQSAGTSRRATVNGSIGSEISDLGPAMCQAVVDVWLQLNKVFPPTAEHFHYNFSLRDLSRVVRGLAHLPRRPTVPQMPCLWLNEMMRVFGDRLALRDHYETCGEMCLTKAKTVFADGVDSLQNARELNILPSLLDPTEPGDVTRNNVSWTVIQSYDELRDTIYEQLEEVGAKTSLVLFEQALDQLVRIARVLLTPSGNATLVGVGGSGKQSLATLAAKLVGAVPIRLKPFSLNNAVTDFRNEMSRIVKQATLRTIRTVLIVDQSELVVDQMFALLNTFLYTGAMDVFSAEDQEEIRSKMTLELRSFGVLNATNPQMCDEYFHTKSRQLLRIVFGTSPESSSLRSVFHRFPGFNVEAQLIFFYPWPTEALKRVAKRMMSDTELGSEEERQTVCEYLAHVHNSVRHMCVVSASKDRRKVQITPKSFLAYVELSRDLIKKEREAWQHNHDRLVLGLEQLRDCGAQVATLQVDLKEQQEEAKDQAIALSILLERVSNERGVVEDQNEVARREEAKTNRIVGEVDALVAECERDLKAAEPMVVAARAALNTLNKANLTELKSMSKPPEDVSNVTGCVLCLTARGRVPRDRSWNASKRMMVDVTKWMKELLDFDVNNIPQQNVDGILKNIADPLFTPEVIRTKSVAASSLCAWVVNVVKYHEVRVIVRPKEERLAESRGRLQIAKNHLKRAQDKVAALQERLDAVVAQYEEAVAQKEAIDRRIQLTEQKLQRAQRLVVSLGGERIRWTAGLDALRTTQDVVLGDTLATAAFVAYAGPFQAPRRQSLRHDWIHSLSKHRIKHTKDVDPVRVLFDDRAIASWANEGLPSGTFPAENATIFLTSQRWPLLIDPQSQALRWLRTRWAPVPLVKEKESSDDEQESGDQEDITFSDTRQFRPTYVELTTDIKGFENKMLECMSDGQPVFVHDLKGTDDHFLMKILCQRFIERDNERIFAVGDLEVVVHPKFHVVAQTALANPTLAPEVFAQTTVINSSVTEPGLQDQLMGVVVGMERPELEASLMKLVRRMNTMTISLRECEDILLEELSSAGSSILENERLVTTLEEAKRKSVEIEHGMVEAHETKAQIHSAREMYQPIAHRGALLYFCIDQLSVIDNTYQYSMDAFFVAFRRSLALAQKEPPSADRVEQFVSAITRGVYAYVDRSLFTRHKILFAAMTAFSILQRRGQIDASHLSFILRGPKKFIIEIPDACKDWLGPTQWGHLQALSELPGSVPSFAGILDDIAENRRWFTWVVESAYPEQERLPTDWKQLTAFQKLLLLRCLRPDRLIAAIRSFVSDHFDSDCFEDHGIPLQDLLDQTDNSTPIMFLLSPGADPGRAVEECGLKEGKTERDDTLVYVSMGQGQEHIADSRLEEAMEEGTWIVLQNVHLMRRWVLRLERAVRTAIDEQRLAEGFRLFLTAEPAEHLAPGLLQLCTKIVNEPPSGLKANFVRGYQLFSHEPWEQSTKPHEHHCIVFALCFFHAVAVGRANFGKAGWNRKYPFGLEDLVSCADVLTNYLEERPRVPWEDLRYVFGEIMYGGHITDSWDRRLCMAYFEHYLNSTSFERAEIINGISFPITRSHNETLQGLLDSFPDESPALFLLSPLSESRAREEEATNAFSLLLEVMPQYVHTSGGGGVSAEESDSRQLELVAMIMGAVPDQLNMEDVDERLEDERTPFQHMFYQECERLNLLSAKMKTSLEDLEGGLKGTTTMTDALRELLRDISEDNVPEPWRAIWGATKRPLGSWTLLVGEAYHQLTAWTMDLANPKVVHLNCFMMPVAFLTALLQDTALRMGTELDQLVMITDVTKKTPDQVDMYAREGSFIFGPSLEGASWDPMANSLREARGKDCQPLPVMIVRAALGSRVNRQDTYACPMYTTSDRAQTYVTTLHLNTKVPAATWILRGAAMILDAQF